MKKILFVTNKLVTGGIETALLETIKIIQSPDVNITVLAINEGGELVDEFKKVCTVKHFSTEDVINVYPDNGYLIQQFKKGRIIYFFRCIFNKICDKYLCSFYNKVKRFSKRLPQISENYDVAVAYFTPYSLAVPYVANVIKAKNKIAWIHHDVHFDSASKNISGFTSCYKKFDKIICVSNSAKQSFVERHCDFNNKAEVLYNPIDVGKINMLANKCEHNSNDIKVTTICSVGRLSREKGWG